MFELNDEVKLVSQPMSLEAGEELLKGQMGVVIKTFIVGCTVKFGNATYYFKNRDLEKA